MNSPLASPPLRLALTLAAALLLPAGAARAEVDPDTELAQRLFKEGGAHYVAGDYQKAIEAFAKARLARPLPAFDFNIARCHDRMGRWLEALAAYEKFLVAAGPGDAEEVKEVRARIDVLKTRVKSAADRKVADEHYRKALGHVEAGAFPAAVAEFRAAYHVSPDPFFLYNVAQVSRLAGDIPGAVASYKLFLEAVPGSPLKPTIEARLVELEALAKAGGRPTLAVPSTTSAPSPTGERLKPVAELIKANRAGFRACFDAWSKLHPGISAKVTFSFLLDPDGILNQPQAVVKDLEAPDMAACIISWASTLRFPSSPTGRYARVSYPFDFKAN